MGLEEPCRKDATGTGIGPGNRDVVINQGKHPADAICSVHGSECRRAFPETAAEQIAGTEVDRYMPSDDVGQPPHSFGTASARVVRGR